MTDFRALIRLLSENNVDFIIVGGAAATAHGSARLTQDLDVVYGRDTENISRLVEALRSIQPYLRGVPPVCRLNGAELEQILSEQQPEETRQTEAERI